MEVVGRVSSAGPIDSYLLLKRLGQEQYSECRRLRLAWQHRETLFKKEESWVWCGGERLKQEDCCEI